MPLETANFISDLVTSNPAASDGLNNTDDHLRLIKAAVKTSFPNITGAVTASHTQLNSLLSQLNGTTVYTAPLGAASTPGYAFVGDLNTGMYSPAADRIAFAQGGQDVLNFAADKTANFPAAVAAVGPITGPGSIPIGGMIMWLSDTLPSGHGSWCWANGGTLSRTTVGGGKELYDLWGTAYGAGNGTTTFNVINMQEVVPVGKSTMGAAASPGLLTSISAGLKAVLGGLFGADTRVLDMTMIPQHDHNVYLKDNKHTHLLSGAANQTAGASANPSYDDLSARNTPNLSGRTSSEFANITIGSVNGTANDNKTATAGQASPAGVGMTQPSRTVNFIIRYA